MIDDGPIIKFNEINISLSFDNESICLYNNINSNDRLPSIDLDKLIGSIIYMYNCPVGVIKEFIIQEDFSKIECII